jgi:Txe/YoeB family toxin of Txe-Axe toxin-antitoxin module
MTEKSNQELYDKMIEGFNKILEDTHHIKDDTFAIKDKTDPTHHNVRDIYSFAQRLLEKVDKLTNRVSDLEDEIKKLRR